MAAITNSVDIGKVQGCVSSSVSASVFSYQCIRSQGKVQHWLCITVQRSVCVHLSGFFFFLQHSRSSNDLMRWLSDCGGALMVMLFVPDIQSLKLSLSDKELIDIFRFSISIQTPVTVGCFLDRGNTEVFRQRKARVSVACGFLSFGVSPHVLVSVAGVALQQQLRHTG